MESHTPRQILNAILSKAIEQKASDVHIQPNSRPMIRIDSSLRPLNIPGFSPGQARDLVVELIGDGLHEKIIKNREELDFSFSYEDTRFRVNVFYSTGNLSAAIRILPKINLDPTALGVPDRLLEMVNRGQGLILVTGPTGHGKTTTIASIVHKISQEKRLHIVTIEDPVEYIIEPHLALISQREVGVDTPSFSSALHSALREDPDVVVLGEMRDLESIETALEIAETGHLVIATLHTNSSAQTADRIVGAFPTGQQKQIRQQLSEVLLVVTSQRLLPKLQGGRVLATELLVVNSAVRTLIREGKTHQLPNLIQTSASEGMISIEKAMAKLVNEGTISVDEAMIWANDPKQLQDMLY